MENEIKDLRDPGISDNALDLLRKGYKLLAKQGIKP